MIKTTFTEMEYSVIDELKEVYDPVVMTEEEEHIESVRRQHKTENDIRRARGRLQEDEELIVIEEE